MLKLMNIIYTISLILFTVILNVSIMLSIPLLKDKWYVFKSGIKRVLTRKPKQDVNIITLATLTQRIEELEKHIDNVAKKTINNRNNDRSLIKQTVRDYLEELKTKK